MNHIKLQQPYIVAPLAGFTDFPFRKILRRYTSGLIHTEMITASSIVHNLKRVKGMFNLEQDEHPIGIQLVGHDEYTLSKAVEIVAKENPTLIDINFSCPVKKIVKSGAGAALLLKPGKLAAIAKQIVKISPVPVTAKIRIGFDKQHINGPEIAKRLEQAGITMVTVHGRLRSQFYSGAVRLDLIRTIKNELTIPVIGNGGLYDVSSIRRMIARTNVNGVQLATGILRRPWLIRELCTGEKPLHPEKEMLEIIELQYQLFVAHYGEEAGLLRIRKYMTYYSDSLLNFNLYLRQLYQAESLQAVRTILNTYKSATGISIDGG